MTLPSAHTPLPQVLIDGQYNDVLSSNTLSAFVEETIQGLYRCEIVFNNSGPGDGRMDYLLFDRDTLDFGQGIALRLDPDDPPAEVFSGRIMALGADFPQGGGARLTVLAEDRLQDLRMTRRTRSFEDMTDANIIEQIAQEHGLSADVSMSGPVHQVVTQVNLSDLAFVRERARMLNCEIWVQGQTLHARSRADRRGEKIRLTYGSSLTTFTVLADLSHQCTELHVTGWDVASKAAIKGMGDASAVNSEISGGTGGSAILEKALGPRIASIVHTVPLTHDEADRIAQARYQERARRFVTGSGTTDGDARIRVGIRLALSRLGRIFDGEYDVTRTLHTYSVERGFQTAFDVERAWIGHRKGRRLKRE